MRVEGRLGPCKMAVLRLDDAVSRLLILVVTLTIYLLLNVYEEVGLCAYPAALDLFIEEGLLFEVCKLVVRVAVFV